jgi:hypothetical protein
MPAEKTQPFCPCSKVLNGTGKGLIVGGILCDLQKAFEHIIHNILFS